MAAGDTIPGQVRVRKQSNDGSEPRVLGPLDQSAIDYHNRTVSPDEELYVNTWTSLITAPSGAQKRRAPRARFGPGETMIVEHKAASLAEAIDHDDADLASIDTVFYDRNTGARYTRTLTVNDTELTANPTSSTSSWVSFYEFSAPSEQEFLVAGSFGAIAPENA